MEALMTTNLTRTSPAPAQAAAPVTAPPSPAPLPPPAAPRDWLQSLEHVIEVILKSQGREKAHSLLASLAERLRADGLDVPKPVSTPYINTIPVEHQPAYPGNRELERRIKSLSRW